VLDYGRRALPRTRLPACGRPSRWLSRWFYIPEGGGRSQGAGVPVFVAFPGRFWACRERAGVQVERPAGRTTWRPVLSRLTVDKGRERLWGMWRAPCAGRVRGRRAAAFIPSGVPATGGRGGMGRVRVRAAGSIRPAGRPPVAGASKTSDHALPASVPAHAACCELVARARTCPSRIA